MSTQPNPAPSDPQPFFTDPRTFAEKLAVTDREWRPHQPQHNCPATICGLVLELGTYTSSYGNGDTVTTCRVLTEDNVVWSIVAFHGYLESELRRKRPRVNDFAALVYRGTVPAKKKGENDAYDYLVVVERNPAAPVVESVAAPEPEPDKPAPDEPAEPETDDGGIPF